MKFLTLKGNIVNLPLDKYRINWKSASLSKFQTRIKDFFGKHFKHLDWYEEVPLVGENVSRLRFDFLCIFDDKWGRRQKVFVEVQGNHHDKRNPKFQPNPGDFEDQMMRDELKVLFAAENSKFPVLEFFEDDPPLTLKWFNDTFNSPLPEKSVDKNKKLF